MTFHSCRFFRCIDEPGEYRAVCTCGWSIRGDLEYIQGRAATHDLDEIREPPLKTTGFVSGLPKDLVGENSK